MVGNGLGVEVGETGHRETGRESLSTIQIRDIQIMETTWKNEYGFEKYSGKEVRS